VLLFVTENAFLGELVADELNYRGVPALALSPTALHGFLEHSDATNVVVLEENRTAGHELCRRLLDRFPDLIVVQLGEGRSIEELCAAYAAGMHAVVPKTPNLTELITRLNQLRLNADMNGHTTTNPDA
jgi:hypothetical protein